jgi:hypothetical protein
MEGSRSHEPAGLERHEPATVADLEQVDELSSLDIEELEPRLTPIDWSSTLGPVYRQVGWGC